MTIDFLQYQFSFALLVYRTSFLIRNLRQEFARKGFFKKTELCGKTGREFPADKNFSRLVW
jgi:hypothetical protein